MEEIWKPTYLTENYEVSNLGNIRNSKTKKLLKLTTTTTGKYIQVGIYVGSKKNSVRVHKLVMRAFKQDSYFEGAIINHIDCNKQNNKKENLEWCTQTHNRKHASEHGLILKGNRHKNAILKEHQIPVIRNLNKILDQTTIGKLFSVDNTTISKIVTGKNWTHC